MIHSGAVMGGLVSRIYTRLRVSRGRDQPLNGFNERRDFVAAGATAGVSAAFGAPMGACLFAIEEGTSHMSPRILLKLFFAAAWAALVVRLFHRACLVFRGEVQAKATLGSHVPVFFERFEDGMDYSAWELLVFAFIGVIGGVIGGLFNLANKQLTLRRRACMPAPKLKANGLVDVRRSDVLRFLEVLFVTFVISSIQFWVPLLYRKFNDQGLEATTREDLSQTEQLFWQSGTGALRHLLHDKDPFDMQLLAGFFVIQTLTTCWTYGLGVPSGLFVPSLLAGAAMGRLFGQCMVKLGAAGPGIYALVGATAMLSGAARITISLAMILMEVTGEAAFSLPIFLTVMVARWVGNMFGRGIYDLHIIDLKRIPLMETDPEDVMIDIHAREVMNTNVVSVQESEVVEELHAKLMECQHHGFPVLREGRIIGFVERDMLHFLLNHCERWGILQESPKIIPFGHFCKHIYLKPSALRPISHLRRVLGKRIDLTPYISKCYHTMSENATMYVCYDLFRKLGLRHLFITRESDGKVGGVITRKDLIFVEDVEQDMRASRSDSKSRIESVAKRNTAEGALGGMAGMG